MMTPRSPRSPRPGVPASPHPRGLPGARLGPPVTAPGLPAALFAVPAALLGLLGLLAACESTQSSSPGSVIVDLPTPFPPPRAEAPADSDDRGERRDSNPSGAGPAGSGRSTEPGQPHSTTVTSPRSSASPPPRPHMRPRVTAASLARACRRRAAWLKARVPRHFRLKVEPPFVVAGNLPRADFRRQLEYGIRRPVRALYASLFQRKPDEPITIVLLRDLRTYRRWARRLFGDVDVAHFGYYKPQLRTMIMNAGSGIGTLWHELTHALVDFDFPEIPDWLNEGLGSLHEGAYLTRTRMVGVTNWRLPGLKEAIFLEQLRSLRSLITQDDFYGRDVATNYAQARFFIQYLQHKKVLARFYQAFRARVHRARAHRAHSPGSHSPGSHSPRTKRAGSRPAARAGGVALWRPLRDGGAALLEKVLGKPLAQVEREFLRWVGRLRYRRRSGAERS